MTDRRDMITNARSSEDVAVQETNAAHHAYQVCEEKSQLTAK